MRVHRLNERDVGVCVKSAGESVSVEIKIRLNGEPTAAAERADLALPRTVESIVELCRSTIRHHGHSPSESESTERSLILVVVVTAVEQGIHSDRFELDRVEGNLVGARYRGCCEEPNAFNGVGVGYRVLECTHARRASANHRGPPCHADFVGKFG